MSKLIFETSFEWSIRRIKPYLAIYGLNRYFGKTNWKSAECGPSLPNHGKKSSARRIVIRVLKEGRGTDKWCYTARKQCIHLYMCFFFASSVSQPLLSFPSPWRGSRSPALAFQWWEIHTELSCHATPSLLD